MKKSYYFTILGCLFFTICTAEDNNPADRKPIYKWEQNGLIHYSHIKPEGVKNAIKLDANGRKIEDYTEEFNEIEQTIIRPKKSNMAKMATLTTANEANLLAEKAEAKMKEENCQITRNNLKALNQGEVYETDSEGNKIRLNDEQLKIKRKNIEKDFNYFCSE